MMSNNMRRIISIVLAIIIALLLGILVGIIAQRSYVVYVCDVMKSLNLSGDFKEYTTDKCMINEIVPSNNGMKIIIYLYPEYDEKVVSSLKKAFPYPLIEYKYKNIW